MGRRGKAGEIEARLAGVKTTRAHPVPRTLGKIGRALWKDIVASYPEDYFRSGDWPLLQSYCQAFEMHEEAQKHLTEEGMVIDDGKHIRRSPWHDILVTSISAMTSIATKLRLCANSRWSEDVKGLGNAQKIKEKARSGLMFGDFSAKTSDSEAIRQ